MSKQKSGAADWQPPIDREYESQVAALDRVSGHVSDYAGQYQIEPARQAMPTTWTPGKTAIERHQEQRSATIGHLRQMVDQQSQEPQRVDTGNRFVITEDTNAKDRAAAGLLYFIMIAIGAPLLSLGLVIAYKWGWGATALFFTFIGGLLLGAVAFLNWQAQRNSPIHIEKRQRGYDHEYRMYREQNAQRTREMIIGGFMGGAKQDLAANVPVVDGQLLLTDGNGKVRK